MPTSKLITEVSTTAYVCAEELTLCGLEHLGCHRKGGEGFRTGNWDTYSNLREMKLQEMQNILSRVLYCLFISKYCKVGHQEVKTCGRVQKTQIYLIFKFKGKIRVFKMCGLWRNRVWESELWIYSCLKGGFWSFLSHKGGNFIWLGENLCNIRPSNLGNYQVSTN